MIYSLSLFFIAPRLFGFVNPANFLFLGAIVLLLAISLSLSVAVSRHVLAIKSLTQRIALLEKELENRLDYYD